MPLVPADLPTTKERAPWRGLVVGVVAAAAFVVGLAVTAYATRDGAGPVRPRVLEAGMALGAADAGVIDVVDAGSAAPPDAGVVATAEPEPDSGPVGATAPPVELTVLTAIAQPLLQGCLTEALRFDPSLGGRVSLRVELRGRTLRVLPPPGASPVLARCLEQQRGRVEGEPREVNATLRVLLDGLRGTATVEDAQIVE